MISSIVLAAGQSTRMGSPKPLLEWGGESLIAYQVHQLKEAGADEVVVVLGHRSDDIHRTMKRLPCRVMLNPRFQMGKANSLRIGAKAVNRDADTIVIIHVDQPRPAAFIRELIAAHRPDVAATRPTFDGHRGHPVVVSGRLRGELMEATDERGGLRGILEAHAAESVEVPSTALCHLDLNTPEEYTSARAGLGLPA